ncbi:MAG: 50S ribosomal protein L22 [Mycoplasmataceae bacterium RC_NB112A]|nr:MAG: 50S ribosomal protein L22 [Mycoplasmataceae bacterium RC_NB112A]
MMKNTAVTSQKTSKEKIITLKSLPFLISPQKMKVVTQLVRYQNLEKLLKILPFLPHKGGRIILELLQKETQHWERKKLSPSDFYFQKIQTNQSKTYKKINFRAKGRADRVRRRSSWFEIQLSNQNSKTNM